MKLTMKEIRQNAILFSKRWAGMVREKQHDQGFINAFLRVFGIEDAWTVGTFQEKAAIGTFWIDYLWKDKIAIEIKSKGENLDKAFEQLRDYIDKIAADDVPDLLMVSDFENIWLSRQSINKVWKIETKKLSYNIGKFIELAGGIGIWGAAFEFSPYP